MKKINFLTLIAIFTVMLSSCGGDDSGSNSESEVDQYTLKVGNVTINDGDTWTTTNVGDLGNMLLSIENVSDEIIYFKIKVISMSDNVGADNDIELCLGNCYYGIQQNSIYPTDAPFSLQAGETSSEGAAHVKNNDNRSGDITLMFKLYQTDSVGNELTEKKSVAFTYFYDAP